MPKKTKQEEPKDNILSEVLEDFREAWNAKQGKERLFREIYRRYRSYIDVTRETTQSTLFIPESFAVVETVAPRMTARKPTFKAIPRTSESIGKADKAGKLLDYRYDMMDMRRKNKTYAKQALMYGTSMMKMGYDSDKSCPVAEVVDLADIFPCPETVSWQDGYIIHRYFKCAEDLKNSKIKYKNLEKLDNRDRSTIRDDQMRQDRNTIQEIPVENHRDGLEILEWWGFENGKVYVRAVADRSVVIRDEESTLPLDELPFVELFDQEVPFDKWGIGEIEPILDLQDEENTIRNQRIDEKNLSIHNMWIASKMAGIDYKTLVSKPGGVILANDINGIKPLDKQNITQNSLEELRMLKEDIRNTTGVNDFVRGANTGVTTATETAVKTQESNHRFAEKIDNFEISQRRIGKWILALDAAYTTEEIKIQIMGDYGYEEEVIKPEDISDEFDIDIEAGSSLPANPELRRQQLRELFQVVTPILSNPNGLPDGVRELLRLLIQSYDLKNTDEILQGAQHPEVGRVMAQLDPNELEGMNKGRVEAEVRRNLQAGGNLMPVQQGMQQGAPQPPMRGAQMPNPVATM